MTNVAVRYCGDHGGAAEARRLMLSGTPKLGDRQARYQRENWTWTCKNILLDDLGCVKRVVEATRACRDQILEVRSIVDRFFQRCSLVFRRNDR